MAQLGVGLVAITISSLVLLAVAAPVYGIPAIEAPERVLPALVLGAIAFVACGITLGTVLPSARSAQAIGLLLFFPSFLLGAGGPPPNAMGATLRDLARFLPLTQVTDAIRDPWLGIGPATGSLAAVTVLGLAASVLAARRRRPVRAGWR